MLRRDKQKPHRVKWAEAERELAIRWVVLPNPIPQEKIVPWNPVTVDPSRSKSDPIPR